MSFRVQFEKSIYEQLFQEQSKSDGLVSFEKFTNVCFSKLGDKLNHTTTVIINIIT